MELAAGAVLTGAAAKSEISFSQRLLRLKPHLLHVGWVSSELLSLSTA